MVFSWFQREDLNSHATFECRIVKLYSLMGNVPLLFCVVFRNLLTGSINFGILKIFYFLFFLIPEIWESVILKFLNLGDFKIHPKIVWFCIPWLYLLLLQQVILKTQTAVFIMAGTIKLKKSQISFHWNLSSCHSKNPAILRSCEKNLVVDFDVNYSTEIKGKKNRVMHRNCPLFLESVMFLVD